MTITKENTENGLRLMLAGRLDTTTAPDLERELNDSLDGVAELLFDMAELEYISSAGLRVLLAAQKRMNKQGSMVVEGANESIREIFDITGFADILTLK